MILLKGTICFLCVVFTLSPYAQTTKLPVSWHRQSRFFNPVNTVKNWFHGDNSIPAPTIKEYPLWKVHKYNGISLKPVAVIDSALGIPELVPKKEGPPPTVVSVPHYTSPTPPTEYGPPSTIYDPPSWKDQESVDPNEDSSALDLLGSLASLIPEKGSLEEGSLLSFIASLPQGTIDKISSFLGLLNYKNTPELVRYLNDYLQSTRRVKADVASSITNAKKSFISKIIPWSSEEPTIPVIESGTYSAVPENYPGSVSFWSKLPFISKFWKSDPVSTLPEPPKLPYIYFPKSLLAHKLKHKGPYVSIIYPKPTVQPPVVPEAPHPTYGVPELPKPSYGVPEWPTPVYVKPNPSYTVTEVAKPTYTVPELPKPIYGVPELPKPVHAIHEYDVPIPHVVQTTEFLTPPLPIPAEPFYTEVHSISTSNTVHSDSASSPYQGNTNTYFEPSQQILVNGDPQAPVSGHVTFHTPNSYGFVEVNDFNGTLKFPFNTKQGYIVQEVDAFAAPSEQVEQISKPDEMSPTYSKVVLQSSQSVSRRVKQNPAETSSHPSRPQEVRMYYGSQNAPGQQTSESNEEYRINKNDQNEKPS